MEKTIRQNNLNVTLHLVWATWNRLPLITEESERDLYRYIEGVCRQQGCDVLAVGGMADHVHLLIALPSTKTIADLMEEVKGASSRFMTETLTPGAWFKWQGNYGAFSVSAHDKRRVMHYIESQKEHHGGGTTWPAAEETYSEIMPAQAGVGPKAP